MYGSLILSLSILYKIIKQLREKLLIFVFPIAPTCQNPICPLNRNSEILYRGFESQPTSHKKVYLFSKKFAIPPILELGFLKLVLIFYHLLKRLKSF